MRIWCQTGFFVGQESRAGRYLDSMRRRAIEVARPDTVVDFHGVDSEIPGMDRYVASNYLLDVQYIKNALRAEAEGYDVYATAGTADHAYDAIREAVSIPVCFITETSLQLACQMVSKFGFLTHNEVLLAKLGGVVRRYGLGGRMVEGAFLKLSYRDFTDMYSNPGPYVDLAMAAGREVVARGAGVLLLSGNPFGRFMLDQGVREIDGAPILDSLAALIKTAELMADLKQIGIARPRLGPHGAPTTADLIVMRKLFGLL